ncbi:MAG TPA: selenocysteine-specific translation elongation factor [Solirubrobacteraceae bacterium]|jgi:selenocysteine-specific elongation factor|nr:selenocysteine-specific translation elongation factor [Solirubrobacteraceae bacterium]
MTGAGSGTSHHPAPLTVGTAGHIDHGKTALVQALTSVDTDRLPEEKTRGITIVLGYAQLRLPSGRLLSLVDVPGHERLIRVMVSGATGIDLFLLVIAADDGVMPQTLEHVRVLEALGVGRGVVAITKSDLADPGPAAEAAAELVPGAEIVACSARTGAGVAEVKAALERATATATARSAVPRGAALHIDRVFTIKGSGTVVTGTLWSGEITRGQRLRVLPGEQTVRVRGLQVHDRPVERALAGQRVAVNLAGVQRREIARGDVLAGDGAEVHLTYRIDVELHLHAPLADRERVQVHHGTRDTPARAVRRDGTWQLRTERPLVAGDGDHVVVRRISPPDTLGGGVIVVADAGGRRQPAPATRPVAETAEATDTTGAPAGESAPPRPALDDAALALEERLRDAGYEPPTESELGEQARYLKALHAHGLAVRIGRSMHAHPEAIEHVRTVVERVASDEGSITLARLRDELGTSRKYAQALLEHLDAARVTRRQEDDSRVLRPSARRSPAGGGR